MKNSDFRNPNDIFIPNVQIHNTSVNICTKAGFRKMDHLKTRQQYLKLEENGREGSLQTFVFPYTANSFKPTLNYCFQAVKRSTEQHSARQ